MLTHVDDDAEQRILLTDFGIARSVDDISGLTTTNMTVGTVAYSAPEQLMGEEIDGRADQYALAATAYHLLTGLQLFAHSNPAVAISRHLNAAPPVLADTRPELAALDPVLAAALAKNPDQRFASCSDFARAFADQVSPTSLAIPIAPTASAPLPLAGTSSVDAVAEDSGAEKVSSHHAPEVANDPAADSASDAPTQQALVSAGKARLAGPTRSKLLLTAQGAADARGHKSSSCSSPRFRQRVRRSILRWGAAESRSPAAATLCGTVNDDDKIDPGPRHRRRCWRCADGRPSRHRLLFTERR